MANQVKVAMVNSILTLRQQGWSLRKIAKALGIHRETVARHVRLAQEGSKPATDPTLGNQEPTVDPEPGDAAIGVEQEATSKPANPTLGSLGPPSLCKPFQSVIEQKLDAGLCAKRIWQDLAAEHGFKGSYASVKRFVRRLGKASPLPFRRMECEPAQEAQVDFGQGAPVENGQGKRRRPHVFRIVLSHSRKARSQSVWRQTTDEFIRVLEDAFWAFGGVPKTIVVDNLRAAVKKADWFDPELTPKVEAFCRHYGTVILPARPYTPRHKGKVESGIKYVQNNALKGRVFKSLAEQNQHLQKWESQVADHRIHGTTKKQVQQVFQQVERQALLPLPSHRFPFFHEAERSVHRDAHVEMDKAYYSVPPEYMGRRVWVRWDTRLVRVFNQRFEQIAVHIKRDKGRFSTDPEHIASEKISGVERGADFWLKRTRLIGPQTERWAQTMLLERGIQGVRVLMGLVSLADKHAAQHIEQACEAALAQGAFRLKALRTLMQTPVRQEQFDFVQDHPLIRSLDDYGRRIPVCFRQPNPPSPSNLHDAHSARHGAGGKE